MYKAQYTVKNNQANKVKISKSKPKKHNRQHDQTHRHS